MCSPSPIAMHREIECVAPDFPGSVVYGELRPSIKVTQDDNS